MGMGKIPDRLSPDDIIKYLWLSGSAESIVHDIIIRKTALEEGRKRGIEISDDDLQRFADNFRSMLGLFSAEETYAFLEKTGLSIEDFEHYCEESLMLDLLKNHLTDENTIQSCFINHRSDFDKVNVSMILVNDENLARELYMRITEDGESFNELASRYSLHESRLCGGYMGTLRRSDLPPDMEARVFNASKDDVLGPFQEEKQFKIIRVNDSQKAELTEETREEIKNIVFRDWMERNV